MELADRFPNPFPPPFASAWGDDGHGLWAAVELSCDGESGPLVQRLRWIEPGTFLMGSPEDEPERSDDEGPRHAVTLTRGFWLADSACTQALWQAVMGTDPSSFKGDPQRPVEQVSWHEVQKFLRKLESLVPGCEAALPTEAQWEYACRAGTDTPFSFGTQITPEQVNYHGDYPYAGGEKGLARGETVAVKTLPANAWGLYEMHGNVWEWCADGLRDYDGQAEDDPQGPVLEGSNGRFAVRGGSWVSGAGWARSAYRGAARPDFPHNFLGFRLCLRSIEPGQEPVLPGGGAGRPPRRKEAGASAKRPRRSPSKKSSR